MRKDYKTELKAERKFLYAELSFMQKENETARSNGDGKEYARLMRLYLPMQKNYLKMCADNQAIVENDPAGDSLLAFANGDE